MSLLDEHIVKSWQGFYKKKLEGSKALIKLWDMREDPIEDTSLFLVPVQNLPEVSIGYRFSADGCDYEVEDIEYNYLFVRRL